MLQGLKKLGPSGVICLIILIALIFFQGGYLQLAGCVTGIIVAIVGIVCTIRSHLAGRRLPWAATLICLLAAVYFISACASGPSLTTLSSAGTWFGLAGFALVVGSQTGEWRKAMLNVVTWIGVIVALLGVLGWAWGVDPLIDGKRLQFTFQYANAAGLWYAVTVFMCLFSKNRLAHASLPIVFAALALTQSFGSFLSLIVVFLVCVAVTHRKLAGGILPMNSTSVIEAPFSPYGLLVLEAQALVALVFTVLMWVTDDVARGIIAILFIVVCIAAHIASLDKKVSALPQKRVNILALGVIIVACLAGIVVCVVAFGRVSSAWSHLVERLIQMGDAIGVWLGAPLLGVGPDNWQYVYQNIQTAQYHSATVHSSYVKILVDAGIVGLACYVAAIVLGARALVLRRDAASLVFAAVIVLHGFVDFDARFESIQFLLVLLLCVTPTDEEHKRSVPRMLGGVLFGLLCLIMCLVGSMTGLVSVQGTLASETATPSIAQETYESDELARADTDFLDNYVIALSNAEEYDDIVTFYKTFGANSDAQALYVARALFATGQTHEAQRVLIDKLLEQPANYDLFEAANSYFEVYGMSDDLQDDYQKAVDQANELISTGWATALSQQQTVPKYSD